MSEKKKILIIDDEIEFVDMISMRLQASGYNVVAVYDGDSVLNKVRSEKPDLIILDVMLPKADGYQVCELIKKDPIVSKIPIVVLTAKDPSREVDDIRKTGVEDCFIKPFDPKQLLAKIKQLIKNPSQD